MEEKPCTYLAGSYPNAPANDGVFIRFADTIYFDDGGNALPQTVALVRTAEGKVLQVEPHLITFKV